MEQLVQIASSTMKRVESITEIVTMRRNVSFRSLPMGFNWDTTKLKGFRVNMTYWQAFCSIIDPSHNEFWNITTDWVPMGGGQRFQGLIHFAKGALAGAGT